MIKLSKNQNKKLWLTLRLRHSFWDCAQLISMIAPSKSLSSKL